MESSTSTRPAVGLRGWVRWPRWLRLLPPLTWLAATVWFVAAEGLPLTRDWILAWVLLGLLAFSFGDLRGWFKGALLDWLPFFLVLAGYDLARGAADGLLFEPFFLPQIEVDRFLFGGQVPTVWLQERLYTPGTLPWYGVVAWVVYMSHFFATPLLAAILWKLDRPRFRRYAVTVAVLSLAGFATYALYPAAPPWMAAEHGLIPPVARAIPEIWGQIGIGARFGVVGTGYEYANDVAAVPSLHAAFSLLICLELWGLARRWYLRTLLVAYPLVMGFALVWGGEHYVADLLLGWIYAVAAYFGVRWLWARWARRRRDDAATATSGSFSTATD
jgi:hypothetical protein